MRLVDWWRLSLFQTNAFSIKLHKIKSGWPTVYIEGPKAVIFRTILFFFSLKIDFVLENSALCSISSEFSELANISA